MAYARLQPTGDVGKDLQDYVFSKFAQIQYSAALAADVDGLTVISVNPGYFRTGPITQNEKEVCEIVMRFQPCPMSPAQGATGIAYAAFTPGLEGLSGKLIDYNTTDINATSGMFHQFSPSCIARPLPAMPGGRWGLSEQRMLYQQVNQTIASVGEGPLMQV